MKKYIASLLVCLICFSLPTFAELNWQAVITSDGLVHKVPADAPQELINAFIDAYENMLEELRVISETPVSQPC